jgi:hypothetical protein
LTDERRCLHRLPPSATALSSRTDFSVHPMNWPSQQTGPAPLSRALAILLFFMADFGFLIFIMAQPHGQMLSM